MGAVDELNAVIGLALVAQREKRIRELLLKIQDDLFTVGAEIAMAHASKETRVPKITESHVARLEAGIEARLHWARTVARRAERRVVALSKRTTLNPDLLRYMNRLSSVLYQMAVWVQRRERKRVEHPTYRT